MTAEIKKLRDRLFGAIHSYEIACFLFEHGLYKRNPTFRHIYGQCYRNIIITLYSLFEGKNNNRYQIDHISLEQFIDDLPHEYSIIKEKFKSLLNNEESELYQLGKNLKKWRKPIAHSLEHTDIKIDHTAIFAALEYAEIIIADLYNNLFPLNNDSFYTFEETHKHFKSEIRRDLQVFL